jgi:hypothetical protein
MNISGPLAISPLNPSTGQELNLRPFQRVVAQVLSVTGTQAILSIDGYPIVAQLSSSDQAAALLAQQTAQFIVTQLTDQVVTLKFVKNDPNPSVSPGPQSPGSELAARILEQNGIPLTNNTLSLARSALNQHLPVTPELLNELVGALSTYGSWEKADIDLATAMKAAGLPVTAQSLALASRPALQTGESLKDLISLLSNALKQNLPPETLQQLNSNIQLLNDMVLQWTGASGKMGTQMKSTVDVLGRSIENLLKELSQQSNALLPEKNLMSLVKLQQSLRQEGKNDLADAIDKFLGDIRQNQFINVKPDPVPGRGAWSEIGFLLSPTPQDKAADFTNAQLRIAHEGGPEPGKINPAYTRLLIQVEVNPGEIVEVDLSLVGKQIRTLVTAPDPEWVMNAQMEMPSLEEALQGLGYTLKDTQIGVGIPRPFGGITTTSSSGPQLTVDIEV